MSMTEQIRAWGWGQSLADIRAEIDEELEFHIQSRVDELLLSGMPAHEARKRADCEFGDRKLIGRTCQDIQSIRLRLLALAGAGLVLLSATAIIWLAWSLYQMKRENASLSSQLQTTMASLGAMAEASSSEANTANLDETLSGQVSGADGSAIANARVLLVHKSWPGGRYQQQVFETTTDMEGKYQFAGQYRKDMQNAFLVTILADGHELMSQYKVVDQGKSAGKFNFRLKEVASISFQFATDEGPLANTLVFIHQRTAGRKEHLIYAQSRDSASWNTDDEGRVDLAYFAPGDVVQFSLQIDGEWRDHTVKIADATAMVVNLDGGAEAVSGGSDISGLVKGAEGNPVSEARILLVHKSWPGRYRQEVFATTTDANGRYRFPARYSNDIRNAFLVTVLADNCAMSSEYRTLEEGENAEAFDFQLEKASPIEFRFVDEDDNPVAAAEVFVNERKSGNDAHLVYFQSSDSASWPTDAEGNVSFSFFVPGDKVKFAVKVDGEWQQATATIDEQNSQTVVVKKKANER